MSSAAKLKVETLSNFLSTAPTDDDLLDNDEKKLVGLGYNQEFKRELNFVSTFAIAFSVIGILPSIESSLIYGIGYIGLPGITWGWLIAASGVISISLSMAELASSTPTSGGLYYSAFMLSPKGWGPFLSWVTGWSNWLGQVTWAPSVNYSLAQMIFGLVTINQPSFSATKWQIYLLTLMLMTLLSIVASLPTKYLAHFNLVTTGIQIASYFIVCITLLAGNKRESPRFNSNHQVWSDFLNMTDWPNGIAMLMSFLCTIWAQAGFDGAFHLSEECSNADIAVPRAIVTSTTVGSAMGFLFLIVISYTLIDLPSVVSSGFPFAAYCDQVVSKKAALALVSLSAISTFFMGCSCSLTASRVFFSYARDGCFPFSDFLGKVSPVTKTPVRSVWANYIVGILLCLLLFNEVAIGAIFSLGASAAYVAFILPVVLRNTVKRNSFSKGPWNLGKYSPFVGFYAIFFVSLMLVILCFPANRGPNLEYSNMNWTVVCYWGSISIAIFWYLISARKWFKGPKRNTPNGIEAYNYKANVNF
ncbi:uncharacterized protein PRCAT00005071001 [Priceomyces carsonii]|uniref:uncharacterized protein n=1 Tax=Priceomyces carsonii TaxID=28549 RepID=UPI002ED8159B|nr:unnamed protein product [Priceomyces carsonii]